MADARPFIRKPVSPTTAGTIAWGMFVRARLEEGRTQLNPSDPTAGRKAEGIAGDFMKMPVERIFISEAGRMGIGTYAPHDPTTADIAAVPLKHEPHCPAFSRS